ncbi:carboxypeptidase-like regulatory domain-containing protein [Steroidobacter cummioxidans]|uniref:carboxypeptidase-like regulatory domain-containing protein n=1 Tax=Steroidobacter cummioxidans TaxID=1803913 RepID=UPI000E31F71E|nr:carboxypeptidase-like regulatory domain-containing protein [Steroidobacter cummioxidans]
MDRRRTLALVLGLVLCLALLGRWVVRFDNDEAAPADSPVGAASNTPSGQIAEIVQAPRKDSKVDHVVPYKAPMGPGVFSGRVIDAVSREPIREFTVELQQPRPSKDPPRQIKQSFRTQDGRFTYRGLPTGTWSVFTTAAGYQRFDMPDVRISEGEQPQEILIPMLTGLSLRGRIVDEITRNGIASATIVFREASVGRYEGNFRLRPSVRSHKDGSFTLAGVPPGAIRLEVNADNYVTREIETFVGGKNAPVEIALSKGGAVSGYLAGTDALTPVQGEVNLSNLDENTAMQTSTGPAGEFTFFQLPAGRYRLAGRGGGLNGERELVLAHNEQLEGIVLPMTAGHSIRGVISGLRPDEHMETMVLAYAMSRGTGMTPQANPDERGAFEIRGVAPGQVLIEVITPRRGRLSRQVEMRPNQDLTVNFELRTGARLTGRVTRGGKPLGGVQLAANTLSADENEQLQLSAISSNDGDYAIEDVPKGEYVLAVESSYSSPPVHVSGDTVFDIEVPDAQLSGRVFEEGSEAPVVGALVNVRAARPALHHSTLLDRSDHFGQFGIRGLQPGDFVMTAYKPGYELYRAPLSYGSPISDMAIYMRPARGVQIRARDGDSGKSPASISVVEIYNGSPNVVMQLQIDQNGVSYLPSGLAGSSLRIAAQGYYPIEITAWNGQPLEVSLQRH